MVAVADELWEAFRLRDWDRLFALTSDDFAARTDPRWPDGAEFHGREEMTHFLEQFLDAWEELRFERTAEPEQAGEHLLERGRWVGRGRSTGIEGTIDFTVVQTFAGGRLARSDFFFEDDDARAFAHASPKPS
jgi:hypothetical protein